MKRLWILAVLLILCAGCNDPAGPNEMILQRVYDAVCTGRRYNLARQGVQAIYTLAGEDLTTYAGFSLRSVIEKGAQ